MNGADRLSSSVGRFPVRRGIVFGGLIIIALLAFEMFNYSTTDFALSDLLGDLRFLGVRWATILAIAFCGIDFAGIARLFTPQRGADEPKEVWYLFGAWLLAATMNAVLTWWGVSLAALNHQALGNAVIDRQTLVRIVPIFIAVMVWLIRVLIIGTFSVAGEGLFSDASVDRRARLPVARSPISRPPVTTSQRSPAPLANSTFRPAPKSIRPPERSYDLPEPTYHPASMSGRPGRDNIPRQS
jgi:hypothetical protein